MNDTRKLNALLVHESWFGNTARVAEAVASGLALEDVEVTCVDVGSAPTDVTGYDLVVVGAPTHAFGLSRPRTREDAVRRGAQADPDATNAGVREWLDRLPAGRHGDACAAAFDTRADKARRLPFAAAPAADRRLRRRGYFMAGDPTGFVVTDLAGPLLRGELDRATAWGREVATTAQSHLAARAAGSRSTGTTR